MLPHKIEDPTVAKQINQQAVNATAGASAWNSAGTWEAKVVKNADVQAYFEAGNLDRNLVH